MRQAQYLDVWVGATPDKKEEGTDTTTTTTTTTTTIRAVVDSSSGWLRKTPPFSHVVEGLPKPNPVPSTPSAVAACAKDVERRIRHQAVRVGPPTAVGGVRPGVESHAMAQWPSSRAEIVKRELRYVALS